MSKISAYFASVYDDAGERTDAIPWAQLSPNAVLTDWLSEHQAAAGEGALVVGCGLGDDAEAVAGFGYRVTAFDVAVGAIQRCRARFPESTVSYVVADVIDLPVDYAQRFALVIEIRTLQCLEASERSEGARAIAGTVAPGGLLYLRCLRAVPDTGRPDGEDHDGPPWPLGRADLEVFDDAGLTTVTLTQDLPSGRPGTERGPTFTAVYRRPAPHHAPHRS